MTHTHGRYRSVLAVIHGGGRQRGLTIVELMVAMTLSLMIVAALTTLIVNMSRSNAELELSSRQIENGRFAIDLLTEEIQLAGYFGDVKQAGAIRPMPDPCITDPADLGWAAPPVTIPIALAGYTGVGADVPACVPDHRADTSILVVRRLSTSALPAASASAGGAYVQTSDCSLDPYSPPLLISDKPSDFTLQTRACDSINVVRRYINRIYFISGCSECGQDEVPTLKRLELIDGTLETTPIAEGIEEIQFEYGFDTNGDGVPETFLLKRDGIVASAANRWENVMALRVWLVSRTTEASRGYIDTKRYHLGLHGTRGPYNDHFKRRVYTRLVRLNNPAGQRE